MGRRRKTKKKKKRKTRKKGGKIPVKEPLKIGETESDVAETTRNQLQQQQQQQQQLLNEPLFTGRQLTPEERAEDRRARLAGRERRRRRTRQRRRRQGRRRTRRQQQNEEKEDVEEETKTSGDEEMPQEGGGGFDNHDILIIHRMIALHHAGVGWYNIMRMMDGDYDGNNHEKLTEMNTSVFNELLKSIREEYGFGGGLEGSTDYDNFIRNEVPHASHHGARLYYIRYKSLRSSRGFNGTQTELCVRELENIMINRQKELDKIKKELIEIGVEIGKLKEKKKSAPRNALISADLEIMRKRKKKLEINMSKLIGASNNADKMEEINIEVKKILDEQLKKCPENVQKAIENFPTCMICMENFDEEGWNKVMICGPNGHPFHDMCILQWLNNQDNPLCPICKMPWFGKRVPVSRNNRRSSRVAPAPAPAQVPEPPGFRERLRRVRDNIRNGATRLPERIRRQLREHRRRRQQDEGQGRCVLQGGN